MDTQTQPNPELSQSAFAVYLAADQDQSQASFSQSQASIGSLAQLAKTNVAQHQGVGKLSTDLESLLDLRAEVCMLFACAGGFGRCLWTSKNLPNNLDIQKLLSVIHSLVSSHVCVPTVCVLRM